MTANGTGSSVIPSNSSKPTLFSFPSKDELSVGLADLVIKQCEAGIKRHDKFTIAISGGSLPTVLAQDLAKRPGVPWDKWEVFFADERLVPLDHEDSNYRLNNDELFKKVNIPAKQIHKIDTSLMDDPEEIADEYQGQMIKSLGHKESARYPVFDLVLLGMGEDGHTCSLFPGHELLSETTLWVASISDSPKPPAKRITLTLPVINHACAVVFVVAGDGKKEILSQVLDQPDLGLPASLVKPAHPGTVMFFTDEAAHAKTKYPKSDFKL